MLKIHTPLLSIIIPSFNSVNELKSCINSIKNQAFKNFEVIIIDGLSTDGTQDFIKHLEPPFFGISENDKGIYDAMNKGINISKGKWLLFLGSDDCIYSENTLKNIFNNNIASNVQLIIGNAKHNFLAKDPIFLKKQGGVFNSSWSKKLWLFNTVHHQSILYNKDVFLLKKYSLDFEILADYYLNLYLFNKGVKVLKISEIISLCGTLGVSKIYIWKLYKEEVELKVLNSSNFYKPFFYSFVFIKFLIKKVLNSYTFFL